MAAERPDRAAARGLRKAPSGVRGLDEITGGGLPAGRPTLVCGGAGCGKTLLAMEFLVRGALDHGEPGVFVSFEERLADLDDNVAPLGFDLPDLRERGLVAIDHVRIEPAEIEEAGEYDLEGLFVRLGHAIDSVGARRVALDTIEALFAGLGDSGILRAELRRLFAWLKERGVTAVVTAERGDGVLTRHGIEEYVSDCVIVLDHRVHEQISTRRLRVVKYRGSMHGTNEYPFLIGDRGLQVLPITSAGLDHRVYEERVPTGVPGLDGMLTGGGYYRGSSVLISGTPGTGKTSLAAHFVDAACRRGERCLYFSFEESADQLVRNMRSIGLDLERWRRAGLLSFHGARPSLRGLELHLSVMHAEVDAAGPAVVVVDPVTALSAAGTEGEVSAALLRLIDLLKTRGITALLTSLEAGADERLHATFGVSSLMDTWIVLRDVVRGSERGLGLYIWKSRGMAHSRRIRGLRMTGRGLVLEDEGDGEPGGGAPAGDGPGAGEGESGHGRKRGDPGGDGAR